MFPPENSSGQRNIIGSFAAARRRSLDQLSNLFGTGSIQRIDRLFSKASKRPFAIEPGSHLIFESPFRMDLLNISTALAGRLSRKLATYASMSGPQWTSASASGAKTRCATHRRVLHARHGW